jgi:methylglutaconyl-CoA hydratase
MNNNPEVRIIVIRGKGTTFCSGADLHWMLKSTELNCLDNIRECQALARCFYEIFTSSRITLCLIHGSSIGGANGLVAASDMAFSESSAVFAFSEVRVGLVPAIIAPYVYRKTGMAKVMELMLTGRRFNADEAVETGLINKSLKEADFDGYIQRLLDDLLRGAPSAQKIIKAILNAKDIAIIEPSMNNRNAVMLADTRITAEAREGMDAFKEKRKPNWIQDY